MKKVLMQARWLALALIGGAALLASAPLCPGAEELPAYLASAKYITTAKCKLCHRAQNTAWEQTPHAKYRTTLPWEQPGAQAEKPAPETVYRYVTGYNAAANTWAEKGTACEACHGPGSTHMGAGKAERKAVIVNPAALDTLAKQASVCGRCHGQYSVGDKRFAEKFMPGQDLFGLAGFKLDAVEPGKKLQELNELAPGEHFKKGVVCITCHAPHAQAAGPHQLRKATIVELCTGCHKDKDMATHAPGAAEGSNCATCHMPDGQHTFVKPQ